MKKIYLLVILAIYLSGIYYLSLPGLAVPDLDNAVRSNEPGDTWQNPEQKGFYTNATRQEVIEDIQGKYKGQVLGNKVPSFRLNYRPEEAMDLVRDQMKSNYLEEIIYPFRESLFVNGWEPKNDPKFRNITEDELPRLAIYDVEYQSKVTLRPTTSEPWARMLIWSMIFPATYFVIISLRKSLILNV